MSSAPSLTDILFAERSKPRGDEASPHIGDLYKCLRAVWYRRNGFEEEPADRELQAKFQIGHDYEHGVARTLRAQGHLVTEGVEADLLGLRGHPDLIVAFNATVGDEDPTLLIETKTTDARKPKDQVQPHHALQAAAYALALGLSEAVVLVKHAGSHVETEYWIQPEASRALIERKAAEIHAKTGQGAPMPPAVPSDVPPYDECQYCRFRQCERNPQHDPNARLVQEEVPF
jgi:CRISPR/Cas system-associated exonuclease Cas4 (RecB family)